MKKKLTGILAIAMVGCMALAGCGGSPKQSAPETKAETEAATEAAETEAVETEAAETEAATTAAPETEAVEAETEAAETEAAEEEAMAALGHIEGNVYTNETFGLHAEASAPWVIANEEEMAEIRGLAAEAVNDEELAQALLDSGTIYDVFIQNTNTTANINVVLQDIGLFGGIIASNSSNIVEEVLPQVESAYKNAGYEVDTCEQSSVTFMGEETDCIATHFTANGIEMYQRQIYRTSGRYLAVLTFTGVTEADLDEGIALFN